MKRFTYTLLPLLFFAFATHAQVTDGNDDTGDTYSEPSSPFHPLDSIKGQIGLFALTTPFMQQQSFGGGIDIQAWYTNNLSVGLSVGVAGRKVTPTFGYAIGQSLLTYYDISLLNEYKIQQWGRLEAAVRLYTGFAVFHLADNSIKVPYTWYDEYGFAYEGEKALPVENNYFFRVAPAFALRYRVASRVMIEGSTAYNFFIGNARFGRSRDFNNYVVQLGVKIDFD